MTRRNKKTRTTFENWLEEKGVEVVAKKLGVGDATVKSWLRGACDPRVDQLRRIKHWTRGRISYEAMIDRPTPCNSLVRR